MSTSRNTKTTLDLLRHGDVYGGTRLLGHSDAPLSELGWRQLRAKVCDVNHPPWDCIIASPLRRCAEFAAQLGDMFKITVLHEPRLREMSFGEWDGMPFDELYEKFPQQALNFWRDPFSTSPPGGENFTNFLSRIQEAWAEVLASSDSKHCLLVIHGGVIRTLLLHLFQFPASMIANIAVPYACLSRIEVVDHIPRLIFHNANLPDA